MYVVCTCYVTENVCVMYVMCYGECTCYVRDALLRMYVVCTCYVAENVRNVYEIYARYDPRTVRHMLVS